MKLRRKFGAMLVAALGFAPWLIAPSVANADTVAPSAVPAGIAYSDFCLTGA